MYDLNDPVEGIDYLNENFNSCTAKQPIEIAEWTQVCVKGTENGRQMYIRAMDRLNCLLTRLLEKWKIT